MGTFAIYVPVVPPKKDIKEAIDGLEQWFTNNPKRKNCRASLWSPGTCKIRRGHVEEDVNAHVEGIRQQVDGMKKKGE